MEYALKHEHGVLMVPTVRNVGGRWEAPTRRCQDREDRVLDLGNRRKQADTMGDGSAAYVAVLSWESLCCCSV